MIHLHEVVNTESDSLACARLHHEVNPDVLQHRYAATVEGKAFAQA